MALRLPRIPAVVIERKRVDAWLASHAGEAVRLLVAPAGSGKTTCAVLYARARPGRTAFVSLTPETDRRQLFARLARALGVAAIGSYDCLVDLLSASAPLELIVDNVDDADRDAREVLAQLYLDVPAAVRFVFIMRRDETLPLRAARAQGFAHRCDPAVLAFAADESLGCAAAFGLALAPASAAELNDAADGWPIAVAGACRTAALKHASVFVGLADWRSDNALLQAPSGAAFIELFGRFDMLVAGRPVRWIRRRDRQIVQYLAMQPQGAATRHQIVTTFWPNADPQLAAQSLRTACSTIRRAIGACVGPANVGSYFRGERVVSLDLTNAIVSAHEYTYACELAADAYERENFVSALGHYRRAERMYRSPFLAGEPPATWAFPFERRFAAMHAIVTLRLIELGGKSGELAATTRRSAVAAIA